MVRVELAADLFADTDDTDLINSVNDLFRCFVSGQHELVIDNRTADAAARFFPEHLPKHAKAYAALTRAAPNRGAWTGTSQRRYATRVCRDDAVDHAVDLREPAKLVVENSASDRYFVIAIARVFGASRILKALAPNRRWLEFIQAGGSGEIRKVATQQAERFRRRWRVVALYDSDRWLPDTVFEHADHAAELRALEIGVHVLLLREAENYVPDGLLECLGPRHQPRVHLLLSLDKRQRGYFDMKHGFKKKAPSDAEVRPEQATLYPNLPRQIRAGLHDGFGVDLLKHLYDHRDALCERDFDHLGPEAVADLRAMLDVIASQI